MDITNLFNRKVNISELSAEAKIGLRKFYYEMPNSVRMDVALQFREIFPEVTPRMLVHMDREAVDAAIKESSELLKIFNEEFRQARFSFPMEWFNRLRLTVFEESWDAESLMRGLSHITTLYSEGIDNAKRDPKALKFMVKYLRAWLRQKELGMIFYNKIFCTAEYYRLTGNPMSFCEIMDSYLRLDIADTESKAGFEALFYSSLQMNPPTDAKENIFFILDIIRAAGIIPAPDHREDMPSFESTNVSAITDTEVSDNIGQVSIFGTHDFGTVSIDRIKEELLRLNRNTIAEYLGGKLNDTGIAFDISDQVKMILREELSPNMCAVAIKRGNEVDMATLLTHESKTYLLFRKIGNDDVTFGISLSELENGARELIGISNESDFTYTLVGGEELGIKI